MDERYSIHVVLHGDDEGTNRSATSFPILLCVVRGSDRAENLHRGLLEAWRHATPRVEFRLRAIEPTWRLAEIVGMRIQRDRLAANDPLVREVLQSARELAGVLAITFEHENDPTPTRDDLPSLNDIPALDTSSGEWITNKVAAKKEGVTVGTLSDYRNLGKVAEDQMSGIDRDGRKWRRSGTPNSHPWYWGPSLKTSTGRENSRQIPR